jgi:hypothetical protein
VSAPWVDLGARCEARLAIHPHSYHTHTFTLTLTLTLSFPLPPPPSLSSEPLVDFVSRREARLAIHLTYTRVLFTLTAEIKWYNISISV